LIDNMLAVSVAVAMSFAICDGPAGGFGAIRSWNYW